MKLVESVDKDKNLSSASRQNFMCFVLFFFLPVSPPRSLLAVIRGLCGQNQLIEVLTLSHADLSNQRGGQRQILNLIYTEERVERLSRDTLFLFLLSFFSSPFR